MTIFAQINSDGAPTGFYPEGIFKAPLPPRASKDQAEAWAADARPDMPAGVIKISDEDHARWMADQRLRWVKGALTLPAPELASAKAQAKARIVAFADQITTRVTGRYPTAEVASWPTQETEARAVQGGAGAAAAPLLDALAQAAKMTLADYAASVLAKAATYRRVIAAVKAIRDATETAIEAAKTLDDLNAAIETARLAALAKAADLGIAP